MFQRNFANENTQIGFDYTTVLNVQNSPNSKSFELEQTAAMPQYRTFSWRTVWSLNHRIEAIRKRYIIVYHDSDYQAHIFILHIYP